MGSERGYTGQGLKPTASVTQGVFARTVRTRAELVDVVDLVDFFPAAP